jgi:uncharacterized protein
MTTYEKPIPVRDELTEGYWRAAQQGVLVIQRCQDCHFYVHYPRELCPRCLGRNLAFQPVSGRGVVYSYTVMHAALLPGFGPDVPYLCAVVELDEQRGLRMLGNILNAAPGEISIGDPVRVTFVTVAEGVVLPQFLVDGQASGA